MPRPVKPRYIEKEPACARFHPSIPSGRRPVILTVDELEALRLADYLGLDQHSGAERMGISRPTFGRIVNKARHKVAGALCSGHAVRVEGGSVVYGGVRGRAGRGCPGQRGTEGGRAGSGRRGGPGGGEHGRRGHRGGRGSQLSSG